MKARVRLVAVVLALAFLEMFSFKVPAEAQGASGARSSGPVITGKVYAFEKIADGVYYHPAA